MTLGQLKQAVRRLSAQISPEKAQEFVLTAYSKILTLRSWWFLRESNHINTKPEKKGTFSLTRNSDTISSSVAVDQDDVGRYIYVNEIPRRIVQILDGSTFKINIPWIGETGDYEGSIRSLRYQLPKNWERVYSIINSGFVLSKVTVQELDLMDPSRTSVGVPYYFAEAEWRGQKEIELWPVPVEAMTLEIWYRKKPDLPQNDSDELLPIVDPLVELGAQYEACSFMFAYTGDVTWKQMAENFMLQFREILREYEKEDDKITGISPVVYDPWSLAELNEPYFSIIARKWHLYYGR